MGRARPVVNWFLRIASAPKYGAGHVRRSGALARALAERANVTVVLDPDGMACAEAFVADGIPAIAAGTEAVQSCAGVVLDGYHFGEDEIVRWRGCARTLVVIDDFHSPPPHADVVIAPAPHLHGEQIDGVPALMGARYALLGAEFANLPPRPSDERKFPRVVVSFGAVDSNNATGLAIDALGLVAAKRRLEARVLVGKHFPHLPTLRDQAKIHGDWLRLRQGETDLAGIWTAADLAIGAGGVSLLERMACGCPSLCIATADNQSLALSEIESLGTAHFAGALADLDANELANIIDVTLSDLGRLREMSVRGRQLVDGHGATRAVTALLDRRLLEGARNCAQAHDVRPDLGERLKRRETKTEEGQRA